MIHYTTSGGVESSALAIVTIDSPKVILAVDPLYALVDFATSAFPPAEVVADEQNILNEEPAADSPASSASALAFRVEIVNSTIMVLENDTDSETQAIQLSVDQLLVSHQVSRCGHTDKVLGERS
jgi:vacuolar protein sorting-associated protein 13A/C